MDIRQKTLLKNVFKVEPNKTIIYNLNNQKKESFKIINDLSFKKRVERNKSVYFKYQNKNYRKEFNWFQKLVHFYPEE